MPIAGRPRPPRSRTPIPATILSGRATPAPDRRRCPRADRTIGTWGSPRLRDRMNGERPQTGESMRGAERGRNFLAGDSQTIDTLRGLAFQHPQTELREAGLDVQVLEGGPFQPFGQRGQRGIAAN